MRSRRNEASRMSVQALGYIGLRAKELGDWASFGSDFLGLSTAGGGSLAFPGVC